MTYVVMSYGVVTYDVMTSDVMTYDIITYDFPGRDKNLHEIAKSGSQEGLNIFGHKTFLDQIKFLDLNFFGHNLFF